MNRDVQGLFLIAGKLTAFVKQTRSISDEKRYLEKLFLWCSFRLSEKNEKDKKRKGLTPVSATPTHMLRICVNPSFKLFLVASRRPVRTKCPDRPAIAEPRLQVRNAQAPTRIRCCAMSGYSEPRGWIFGCGTGCEHSEIWFILIIPSAYRLNSRPPNHVSATPTHMLRICVNPLSAGVQTMRARICSASSCAMFARVV